MYSVESGARTPGDTNDERDRGQCFSCGFFGHGVNRCTRLDRSFPYIAPGWLVNLRDGEYRASRLTEGVHNSTRGKRGMVRAGGSASRTISNNNMPDPGGGRRLAWKRSKDDTHEPPMDPGCAGLPSSGEPYSGGKGAVHSCAAVVDKDSELDPLCRPEGGGSHRAPLGRLIKAPRRRMRPAGNGGSTRRMT